MAIGSGADEEMLGRFIAGTQNRLFHATDAAQIQEFFQRVTMSVTIRSKSQNPNQVPSEGDLKLLGLKRPNGNEQEGSSTESPVEDDDEGYW